nr:MAG: phosphoribosylglycinamide formyltransferase [Bacteroidia bacterium]
MQVALVLSNSAKAKVLQRAAKYNVPTMVFDRQRFYQQQDVLEALHAHNIDLVVLAGFMWLVPSYLIVAFPNRIVNIHPALLPAYGGKGMYGDHVHKAVKAARETKTGITIHYVNEAYDEGQIIFQAETAINSTDTADKLLHLSLQP